MKITCVMPTMPSRRSFWPGAVRCFMEQTQPDLELLVLNETSDLMRPLEFAHERVRYETYDGPRINTGHKRNMANELADSDAIVHWDDDDWSSPDRVQRQVALLESTGKSVSGVHDLLYLRVADRTTWQYTFPGRPPYACGTSLCYYEQYWQRHRFGNKRVGEDSDFALAAKKSNDLASVPNDGMIVARAHGGNTFVPKFGQVPFLRASRDLFPKSFLELENLT